MESTNKVEMEQASRSEWDVASDLEDVLLGLERSQKAAYIFLEDLTDEFLSPKAYPNFYGKSRLEGYTDGLYLVEDRVFSERERLRALIDELFELARARRKEAAAPPEKLLTKITRTEGGLGYELTA